MPELPEVETIRRGLRGKIVSKKIKDVVVKKPNLIKQSVKFFRGNLLNNSFENIQRVGKLLIFPLKNVNKQKQKLFLLIHLKMTGQLIYCDKKSFTAGGHINSQEEEKMFAEGQKEALCAPGKYTHIIFEFADNSKLLFNDLRQFGYLKIVKEKELLKIKEEFGIEPGRKNFTLNNFQEILEKRKQSNIKAFLLNQKNISGLGNIYADESLFASKINPRRKVGSLTENEQKILFRSIQKIIKESLKYQGTTFSDFVDSRGRKGNFKQKLKVYGRQELKCKRKGCNGIIQKIKVAGRGTHFCPRCQKM